MTKANSCLSALLGGSCLLTVFMPSVSAAPPTSPKRPQKPAAKTQAPTLVVQGKIKAIAKMPRPGTVPYKDAVTAIYLTNVKPLTGKVSQRSILVYMWGLRNNKLTPAASYRAGQSLTLSLQPWDKVERKYGRYQRVELDDDDALALDVYWGEGKK